MAAVEGTEQVQVAPGRRRTGRGQPLCRRRLPPARFPISRLAGAGGCATGRGSVRGTCFVTSPAPGVGVHLRHTVCGRGCSLPSHGPPGGEGGRCRRSVTTPAHDGELLERAVVRGQAGDRRPGPAGRADARRAARPRAPAARGRARAWPRPSPWRPSPGSSAARSPASSSPPTWCPSDILGTRIYRPGREEFDVELGPVFANFVLADEINRAPAKVQSALLEVMAERQVSIGGKTFPMPDPFLVMATQNPIENEGVYPLPEAQRDRFLFKILVGLPGADEEEREIVYRMGVEPPVAQPGAATRPSCRGCRQVADAGVRAPRAGRLRGAAGGRHPHARPSTACPTSPAGRPTAPARAPRSASSPPPGRWRCSAAATTCCRRTSWTSRRTCCGTGSCSPTTRWPTTSRSTTSSPGCWQTVPLPQVTARTRTPGGRLTADATARPAAPQPPPMTDPRPRPAPRRHGRPGAAGRPRCATLELTVRRRLDGLLQGNHLGLVPGPGTEPGEARAYQPGDDVRRMDWPVTARTTVPHVRQTVADRELETWLVVDLSRQPRLRHRRAARSATWPSPPRPRSRHLTARRRQPDRRASSPPATQHRAHPGPRRPGRTRAGCCASVAPATRARPSGTRGDLGGGDRAAAPPAAPARAGRGDLRLPRRRPTWERPLRALSGRHDLLAVEVLDPRELELPDVGTGRAGRPGDRPAARGRRPPPLLRRRFAAAAAAHRDRVARRAAPGRRRAPAAAHRLATGSPTSCGSSLARKRALVGGAPAPTVEGGLVIFAQPWWLAAGLLVVAGARGRLRAAAAPPPPATRCGSPTWSCSTRSRRSGPGWCRHLPAAALLVALALLTVALAGPDRPRRGCRATGPPSMLAIDVSLSMQATDVAPNRLAAAQEAAKSVRRPAHPRGQPRAGVVRRHRGRAGRRRPRTATPVKRAIAGCKLAESHRHRRGDLRGAAVDRDVLPGRRRRDPSDGPAAGPDRADVRRQADRAGPRREEEPRGRSPRPQGRRGEGAGVDDRVRHRLRLDRDRRDEPHGAGRRWTTRRCSRSPSSRAGSSSPRPPSEELKSGLRRARRADRLRDAQGRRQPAVADRRRRAAAGSSALGAASPWAGRLQPCRPPAGRGRSGARMPGAGRLRRERDVSAACW